ncbi:MAG: bifunctional folylpolyglutamate synthase/dihydrofolate synthase, partial [Planctomycetota bacterium]|nr:bifunctional folylpolyglutamate synthase/dihydrofolate synthase [Planctomycetota bacterium]
KLGCTLVTGVPRGSEADAAIRARAEALGVPIHRPLEGAGERSTPERNRLVACAVLDELGRRGVVGAGGERLSGALLDPETAARAALPGRQERFSVGGVPVVLDGAHTPESVGALLSDLGRDPALAGRPTVVFGLAKDKDLAGILKRLGPATERSFCTSIGTDLHRSAAELAEALSQAGALATAATPPAAALEQALAHARARGGWVLTVGSLYLAGALRPLLTSQHSRQAPT